MAFDLATLYVRIRTDATKFISNLRNVHANLMKVNAAMIGMAEKAKVALEGMARHAKRAFMLLGGVVAGAVWAAASYEKQLARVSTMLRGDSIKYLRKYEEGLQALSIEFGESTKTLAAGMYDILSASIAPEKAMEVLRIATETAKGGFTETSIVVSGLVAILNSYQMDASKAGEITDKMAMTVARGVITMEQLSDSIGKAAPMARAAGVSIDELLAAVATLTRSGVGADMAMTQIRSAMVYAAAEGKTFAQVIRGFVGKSLEDMVKMGVDRRSAAGIAALAGSFEELTKDVGLMTSASGTRLEAFAKYQATFTYKWEKAKQSVYGVFHVLGSALLPAISSVAEAVAKVALISFDWVKANKDLVAQVVALVGAFLGVLIILPKVLGLLILIGKTLGWLALSPIGIVLSGLAALATGFVYLMGQGDSFVDKTADGFFRVIKIFDVVLGSWEGAVKGFGVLSSQIGTSLYMAFRWGIDQSIQAFNLIESGLLVAFEYAKTGVMRAWGGIKWFFKKMWAEIALMATSAFANMLEGLKDMWTRALEILPDVVGGISGEEAAKRRAASGEEKRRTIAAAKAKYEGSKAAIDAAVEKDIKEETDRHEGQMDSLAARHAKRDAQRKNMRKREVDTLEEEMKKDFEERMAKLGGLPKLSEKIKGVMDDLKKGLAGKDLADRIAALQKEYQMAAPPEGAFDAKAWGMDKAKVGKGEGAGKFEGLDQLWKRLLSAGVQTPEQANQKEQIKLTREQNALINKEVKQLDDLIKAVEKQKRVDAARAA